MIFLASVVVAAVVFGIAAVWFGEDTRRDERNW
jgi:hypothetical protein